MFAICIDSAGYEASLVLRKVYRAIEDPSLGENGLVRVIDESGEDYVFSAARFVAIEVPAEAKSVFEST